MQLECRIVKEKMFICPGETNHVFLLSIRQDPLRRKASSTPTPGRFALFYKRNNIDLNKFRDSFSIQRRAFMSIFIKKYLKLCVLCTKMLSDCYFVLSLLCKNCKCIYKICTTYLNRYVKAYKLCPIKPHQAEL